MKQEHSTLSPVPGETGFQSSAWGPGLWRRETAVPREEREGGVAGSCWLIGVCLSGWICLWDLGPGVQTAGRSDLPWGPEALLAQADPAVPFMELSGHVGARSGGRQASRGAGLQGCGGARLAREPRDPLGAEKRRALSLCPDPEVSSEARGRGSSRGQGAPLFPTPACPLVCPEHRWVGPSHHPITRGPGDLDPGMLVAKAPPSRSSGKAQGRRVRKAAVCLHSAGHSARCGRPG